jgi:hypothetical protein
LEMRNYEIVLGDHPDCSAGPPVSHIFCFTRFIINGRTQSSHENHSHMITGCDWLGIFTSRNNISRPVRSA